MSDRFCLVFVQEEGFWVDMSDLFAWLLCRRKDSRVDEPEQFGLVFLQEEGFEGRCV